MRVISSTTVSSPSGCAQHSADDDRAVAAKIHWLSRGGPRLSHFIIRPSASEMPSHRWVCPVPVSAGGLDTVSRENRNRSLSRNGDRTHWLVVSALNSPRISSIISHNLTLLACFSKIFSIFASYAARRTYILRKCFSPALLEIRTIFRQ